MKVLVTGGAGFLGSHLVEHLVRGGYEVSVFDLPEKEDLVRRYAQGVTYVGGDLASLRDLQRAVAGVQGVCHLAGVGDVYLAFDRPELAAAYNVTGTANLMEACRRSEVQKVVYTSTWEVYGPPRYQPVDENHPCEPDHPYNITKYAGERLALSYDRLRGVPTIALRLGTAYGTRMRPNSVFSIFIRKALAGGPIAIEGTGQQSRQFTHVRDIARAFVAALRSEAHAEAINVVASEQISVLDLADHVTRRIPTGRVFTAPRPGDVVPARITSEKAKRALGWAPEVAFADGINEIIDEHLAQCERNESVH